MAAQHESMSALPVHDSVPSLSLPGCVPRPPPPARARYGTTLALPPPGARVTLADGRRLKLRPVQAPDVAALQRLFARLTPGEIRMRFMHSVTELPDVLARRMTDLDHDCELAWVLLDPADDARAEMRGIARLYIDAATAAAEFALLVEQAYTGQGLGALLMAQLIRACRERVLHEIWGHVLAENHAMLDLCAELGFTRASVPGDPGVMHVRLTL